MGVSNKFAVALSAIAFLLAGCGGSLWPSLEAEDPAGAPPAAETQQVEQQQQVQAQQQTAQVSTAPQQQVQQQAQASRTPPPKPMSAQMQPAEGEASGTFVGNKVSAMAQDLAKLEDKVSDLSGRMQQIQSESRGSSGEYHELLGSITARLQRGTTPGNPVLVNQWNQAQLQLENVAETIPRMTKLSNDAADQAAFGQYLLNAVQATYGLSGAVEEDHERLQTLEDQVHQTLVQIDRLMTDLSQDISRQNVYVNNERQNMTTLSLAIKNGELYGASLATRAFTQTENIARAQAHSTRPQTGDRPLVIVRFDHPNVQYQQALYNAVNKALSRKPTATFDLVAVSPDRGTAAQKALNNAAARRSAEDVLRTLTDMGVPGSRVQLLTSTDPDIAANEVRLFVR